MNLEQLPVSQGFRPPPPVISPSWGQILRDLVPPGPNPWGSRPPCAPPFRYFNIGLEELLGQVILVYAEVKVGRIFGPLSLAVAAQRASPRSSSSATEYILYTFLFGCGSDFRCCSLFIVFVNTVLQLRA